MTHPERFENVSIVTKANVYFDGKVVSHSVFFTDGSKKTIGLIYPGTFTFDTAAAERMDIVAGTCRVRIAGAEQWTTYTAGGSFRVAANSSFEIAVDQGMAEYICSFE
jgi:uncharacterized protein YaiE (UPF0345 family)